MPVAAAWVSITSVAARTQVRTLFLPTSEFERNVQQEPAFYREFSQLTFGRFALMYRYVADARVPLSVSQKEPANMVGVSRETLRTLLARLKARGLIEIGVRKIRVLE